MKMRKFTGATVKDALAQVKAELGPDAMVLSTRTIRQGLFGEQVEITAALDEPAPKLVPKVTPKTPARPGLKVAPETGPELEALVQPLYGELEAIRQELRPLYHRLGDNLKADLRAELDGLRSLLGSLKVHRPRPTKESLERLAETFIVAQPTTARIVALVGPTGVGKTTTLAKLAARKALMEKKSLALVTLDNYRVGAVEQLQQYADLIGVPMFVASGLEQLPRLIRDLACFESILIDTAGRSWQAQAEIETTTTALDLVSGVETHLVLAAESAPSVVDRWLERCTPDKIDRLIFTKIDEADGLEVLVETPARVKKPVSYLGIGQRVPEDLVVATPGKLLLLATERGDEEASHARVA